MLPETIKVRGIIVQLGGEDWLLAPLPLGPLETLQARIEALSEVNLATGAATVMDAAYYSLKRNYPDITREQIGEMLGLENMWDVINAVMDDGSKRKALEAEKGEARLPA